MLQTDFETQSSDQSQLQTADLSPLPSRANIGNVTPPRPPGIAATPPSVPPDRFTDDAYVAEQTSLPCAAEETVAEPPSSSKKPSAEDAATAVLRAIQARNVSRKLAKDKEKADEKALHAYYILFGR